MSGSRAARRTTVSALLGVAIVWEVVSFVAGVISAQTPGIGSSGIVTLGDVRYGLFSGGLTGSGARDVIGLGWDALGCFVLLSCQLVWILASKSPSAARRIALVVVLVLGAITAVLGFLMLWAALWDWLRYGIRWDENLLDEGDYLRAGVSILWIAALLGVPLNRDDRVRVSRSTISPARAAAPPA